MTTAGTMLARGRVPNAPEAFAELVATHGAGPVALEATANWYYLYECLEGLGVPVHLAHPKQTRLIAASKRKTDQLDAERLAHLLRTDLLPTSYVPPPAVRELRETLRSRARLVRQRTQVKNHLRAVLAKQGLRAPYTDLGGPAARDWLTAQTMRPVYAAERDAAVPQGHHGPAPSAGVGGTRRGVKCLHAHYAWHLAGGDDPVGRWVAHRLGPDAAASLRRLG